MREQDAEKRLWKIWELSQTDPEYREMLLQMRQLETAYDGVLASLPEDQEDVIREFVSQCEAMSWRVLQIACMQMQFHKE